MKKALLVTLEYPPQIGGVANYYYNLLKNLPADKIEVLTNDNNQLVGEGWPILKWLKAFFIIKKIVKEQSIEVILVGQILPLGTVVWLLSKIINIPYIVFTHAMDVTYPQKYPRKKWLMKKILNSADKIITVSRFTKYELLKLIQKQRQRKIEIISPAPNITQARFSNSNIIDLKSKFQNSKILLSVGRIIERKGYDTVISALPLILKKINNLKYIIIGAGEYKLKLKALVKKLNLENNVIFYEQLDDTEVAKYYKICDTFIMASREMPDKDVEGFGLVYLEANSFSKPVIGGKSGGVEDAIIDGQTGFLVEPENIEMISEAVIRLLSQPKLAEKLGKLGQKRVEKEFSWQVKAKQLEAVLT